MDEPRVSAWTISSAALILEIMKKCEGKSPEEVKETVIKDLNLCFQKWIERRQEMPKGLIVIGYQGIGKTSCSGRNGCVDLESSNFFYTKPDGKIIRPLDWYIPYCQIARSIASQGYTVFLSSHKRVRDCLRDLTMPPEVGKVVIFCPDKSMKDEWIKRLRERYLRSNLPKDYRALKNAEDRFEENIDELEDELVRSGFPVYQPTSMDYDLMNFVDLMRLDWCHDISEIN